MALATRPCRFRASVVPKGRLTRWPAGDAAGHDGANRKDKEPLTIFWLCALVIEWLARIAPRSHGAPIVGLKLMSGLLMVWHLAYIAGAVMLHRLVNSVTTRQEGRTGPERR